MITEYNKLDNEQIREMALRMVETYHTDLQQNTFPDEMIQVVHLARARGCSSPSDLASLMHNEDLESTFQMSPLHFALRMFLCLTISNCSGERSFSRMALVKNKLRSTMTDDRLSALELLSVESDCLDNVSFSEIIDKFAYAKSRKCL